MSDYMPLEVIMKILTHLQASLSNSTPFLLIGCEKHSRETLSLHHDNDGFDKLKQLPFPPFGNVTDFPVVGSCNGLICVQLDYYDYDLDFVLWNPSIQKYISLPQANICEVEYFNVGFGFDSKTNDYKLLILGVDKDGSWIEPYLFSLHENCWKKVTALYPNYAFAPQTSLPFVSRSVHWLEYQKRNNGGHSHVILGFDLSAEVFSVINLPQSLTGFSPFDLSVMKYGESSFAVSLDSLIGEFHELKNGEVLLEVDDGVGVGADILYLNSYVKSIVLLDKAVDVSSESDVNHPIDSSDSDESIGGD
ncbi:hypothetical protein V6N11_019360 [Hibiscus sabdariffa]|uniref:F-box associated beta-propeller type 3 domain-containing protein n=1 Tax=Hibiscus sabdariffa TaxID=183260 RepID=A0ABR2R251_9ROSI